MSVTDSDRILAAGKPLILADGRTVTLRFGLRAIKMIEDSFGSLGAIEEIFATDDNGVPKGKVVGPLVEVLAAGLSHEKLTADELLDLLDLGELNAYMAAALAAVGEALPASGDTPPKAPDNLASVSPGASSTTPAPFVSVAATNSSGQ